METPKAYRVIAEFTFASTPESSVDLKVGDTVNLTDAEFAIHADNVVLEDANERGAADPASSTEAGETVNHVITDEDLAANPSLAEDGIKVGDEVTLNMTDAPVIASVVKDGNVVRAYNVVEHGDNFMELANQFASKVGGTVSLS